jgi:hypothetical protein
MVVGNTVLNKLFNILSVFLSCLGENEHVPRIDFFNGVLYNICIGGGWYC